MHDVVSPSGAHRVDAAGVLSRTHITAGVVACALLSVLPFIVAPLPMMPDLFNHMARYFVIYADGAAAARLAAYYQVRWALVGNLGMELLVYPFLRVLGPWNGPIVATALLAPLSVASFAALSRAAWGRVAPTVFLALPFVYCYSFVFGFTNYHLGVALAFLVTAGWLVTTHLAQGRRWLIFAPAACLVWLAHLGGWGVLVVLVGSAELVTAWKRRRSVLPALWRAGLSCAPLAVPVVFILMRRHAGGSLWYGQILDIGFKAQWLQSLLASEWRSFDIASIAVLIGIATFLGVTERRSFDPRLLLAAAIFGILFLVLPQSMFGSFFADERLLPVFFAVLFLSFAPSHRWTQVACLVLGVGLFASRLLVTTVGWHERGRAAAADLAVLETVPEGSRIAVFGVPSFCDPWPMSGYDELPSLAIITRHVFVNTVWDQPSGPIMRPIYNSGLGYNEVNSSYETSDGCPLEKTADAFLDGLPRARFDYVWTFSTASFDRPWLAFVAKGPRARLYRVLP